MSGFSITDRSLSADRGWLSASFLMVGLALIAAWASWAFSASITRYEFSDSARLEVIGSASPIESGVSGAVLVSHMRLGQHVETGQILVQLEDRDQQLEWKEGAIRRAQLEPQLAALQAQVESEDAGQQDEGRVLVYLKSGADAQVREARIEAGLASEEAQRAEKLRAAGLISEMALERIRVAAASKDAVVEGLQQAAQRLSPELKVRDTDRTEKKRQIFTDIAKLQADLTTSSATMELLRYEIARRQVRATVSGILTECEVLHPGAHIGEGQQLGVILPQGRVQVIADFDPASAFGKLHAGQRATVRMDGFPWAQFGVLHANVARVAGEIRNGKVRVELTLTGSGATRIPLQHGLPGTVQIEVERVNPETLLLRSAGQTVGAY